MAETGARPSAAVPGGRAVQASPRHLSWAALSEETALEATIARMEDKETEFRAKASDHMCGRDHKLHTHTYTDPKEEKADIDAYIE